MDMHHFESLKSMRAAWNSYAKHVLPPDCGRTQYAETRRAFYMGANMLFAISTRHVASMPDEEAAQALRDIENELLAFVRDVIAGNA